MNKEQQLHRNGTKVDNLYRAIRNSEALDLIPSLVKQIISDDMWKEHKFEKTGEIFHFDSLVKFIETHPPDGLGTTIEKLIVLCSDDSSTLELLDQAIQNDLGQVQPTETQTAKKKSLAARNTRQAALRRLRRYVEQNPRAEATRQAVLEGRMSLNAAMVELGLRKKRISIPKEVAAATESLKRHYSSDELEQIVERLRKADNPKN